MLETIIEGLKENKVTVGLVALGLLLGAGFLVFNRPSEAVPTASQLAASVSSSTSSVADQPSSDSKTSSEKEASSTIMVDVKGAVKEAGLYELGLDNRVADAIKAAGGMTEQADPKSVNLAQKLSDEAVIYVATTDEAVSVVPPAQVSSPSGSGQTSSSGSETDTINLNTASVEDLQTIPGIGEKRAQDIIAYRDSNGGFQSVDDLGNVSGIGDKTLEKLRSYVTVD